MTALRVVCIDFEPGVPGREIASMVAKTLRLPLLDREITDGAARKLGLSEWSAAMLEHERATPSRGGSWRRLKATRRSALPPALRYSPIPPCSRGDR